MTEIHFTQTTPGSDKHSGHSSMPLQCNLQHPKLMTKVTTVLLLLALTENAFYSQRCSNPTVYHRENQCHVQPCGVLPQLNYYFTYEKKEKPDQINIQGVLLLCSKLQTLGVFKDKYFPEENTLWTLCCSAPLPQCLFILTNFQTPTPPTTQSFLCHSLFISELEANSISMSRQFPSEWCTLVSTCITRHR